MGNNSKLLLKVIDPNKNRIVWVHFCYVNKDLYENFLQKKELQSTDLNEIISQWCRKDFGIKLSMSSTVDIHSIREIVKKFYKEAYPEIYIENETDHQGWLRIWMTKKMKEELYGKESF